MGGDLEVQRRPAHQSTACPACTGADLSSFNDHRVLMALAVAAPGPTGETRLTYPNAYRISYPASSTR